jgi:CO dehydrogenase nickel-insertion accessory protein CooC1
MLIEALSRKEHRLILVDPDANAILTNAFGTTKPYMRAIAHPFEESGTMSDIAAALHS